MGGHAADEAREALLDYCFGFAHLVEEVLEEVHDGGEVFVVSAVAAADWDCDQLSLVPDAELLFEVDEVFDPFDYPKYSKGYVQDLYLSCTVYSKRGVWRYLRWFLTKRGVRAMSACSRRMSTRRQALTLVKE